MSTPYEQNPGQPAPTDAAAPTQFIPAGQVPQPPQPAFGAPAPAAQDAAPQYGQAPQFGQAPQQQPQAPQFGQPQQPQIPQQPQYGQAPQGAPGWGQGGTQPMQNYQDPNANPYANPNANPYGYPGTGQPVKPKRVGVGAVFGGLVGTAVGRLVLVLVIGGAVAAYHFATADPAQRNSNGSVTQSGNLQASDLQVGDCFDAPSADSNISTIKAIPCTQAHDSQVYLEPQIKESTYPGDATVQKEADADCDSTDAESVISQDAPDSLDTAYYMPQDQETFDAGQHYIICAIESDDQKMNQSYISSASAAS